MKRRLAAATAALAVAAPGAATRAAGARGHAPVHGAGPRVTRIGAADSDVAEQRLAAIRGAEQRAHRHALASALAAELPAAAAADVERGLADSDRQAAGFFDGRAGPEGLAATLARTTGASEEQVDAAFEAMARHALRNRRGE